MSRGSRIAIGIVAAIGAYALWMSSMSSGVRASPWVFQLLALFFGIVALACMLPQAHRVTLRIIGAVIFSVCVWTAIDSWQSGAGLSGKDIVKSARLFLIFGAPAAYLMITGRYPLGDHLSVVFNPPPSSPPIAPPPRRSPTQAAPVKPPVKRSRPRKSWKLSDFDVRRLTIGGWLLFVPSSAIFGLGALVGLASVLATGATLQNRIACWIMAIVLMAIAIGFFWLGKVILGLFDVRVVKDRQSNIKRSVPKRRPSNIKRSVPKRPWRLSDFSVRRLTIVGWLLFLPSASAFGFAVLVGLAGFLASKATPDTRIACWIMAVILMAIVIGFFWLGKVILGWFGVAVLKD